MERLVAFSAFASKMLAGIVWLGTAGLATWAGLAEMQATNPPRDAPRDWGTPVYYYRTCFVIFMYVVVALLAFVPNRWLVFSRTAFVVSLIIALLPFCYMMLPSPLPGSFDPGDFIFTVFICGLLPLSLTLSFKRHKKGVRVTYA